MGWLGFSPPFGDDYGCPMCMYRMWKLWTHGDFVDSCSLVSLPPFLESTLRTGVGPWLSCAAVPPTRIVRAGTDRPLACPSFRVPEPARCVSVGARGRANPRRRGLVTVRRVVVPIFPPTSPSIGGLGDSRRSPRIWMECHVAAFPCEYIPAVSVPRVVRRVRSSGPNLLPGR